MAFGFAGRIFGTSTFGTHGTFGTREPILYGFNA
jgi:hypothetical protein